MERQTIYLRNYDWNARIFYDTRKEDVKDILSAFHYYTHCTRNQLREIKHFLISDNPDNGLTFSNQEERQSIVIIGHATSLQQFLNTWQHEIFHLVCHITEEYHIDPLSEDAAYLAGDIAQQMHPILSHYICNCQLL